MQARIRPSGNRMLLSVDVQIRLAAPDTAIVGQSFVLQGFVQDLRAAPQGVAEAFVNVSYDTSLMSATPPIAHGPQYSGLGASGDTNTPGLINTVGGVSTDLNPPANPSLEYLLFSVPFQAVKAGTFTFSPQLLSGSDYNLFPIAVFPVALVDPGQVSLLSHSITISDPINHAPVGTSHTVTTMEDTAYAFAAVDFGFSDPNDTPPNTLLAVKITTLPGAGSLIDNGTSVTSGQFVSAADINGGKLVYVPAANSNGTASDQFTFQVQDNGGTANGGANLDSTPKTMTFNVTPVNDAPVLVGIEAAALGYSENDPATAVTFDNLCQRRGQRDSRRGYGPDHRQLPGRAGRALFHQYGQHHRGVERGDRNADLDRQRRGDQLPGGLPGREVPEHQRQSQRGRADRELQSQRRCSG